MNVWVFTKPREIFKPVNSQNLGFRGGYVVLSIVHIHSIPNFLQNPVGLITTTFAKSMLTQRSAKRLEQNGCHQLVPRIHLLSGQRNHLIGTWCYWICIQDQLLGHTIWPVWCTNCEVPRSTRRASGSDFQCWSWITVFVTHWIYNKGWFVKNDRKFLKGFRFFNRLHT